MSNIEILCEFTKRLNGRSISFYKCKCFCGNEFEVRKSYLLSGHTKSCGCLKHRKRLKIDLTNQVFGNLKVIRFYGRDKFGVSIWECQCKCGNITTVPSQNLKSGNTTSCGCLYEHHNDTRTRLYKCWQDMKSRCYYHKDTNYKHYGGRGIIICEEWKNSYLSFKNWALSNGYNNDLTIDRIDVDGNYEPCNCRWVNLKQQSLNKRNTIYVFFMGEKIPLKTLCDRYNINYKKAHYLLKYKNYDIDRIIYCLSK